MSRRTVSPVKRTPASGTSNVRLPGVCPGTDRTTTDQPSPGRTSPPRGSSHDESGSAKWSTAAVIATIVNRADASEAGPGQRVEEQPACSASPRSGSGRGRPPRSRALPARSIRAARPKWSWWPCVRSTRSTSSTRQAVPREAVPEGVPRLLRQRPGVDERDRLACDQVDVDRPDRERRRDGDREDGDGVAAASPRPVRDRAREAGDPAAGARPRSAPRPRLTSPRGRRDSRPPRRPRC